MTCKPKLERLESKLKSKPELLTKPKGTLTNQQLPHLYSTCKPKPEKLEPKLNQKLPSQSLICKLKLERLEPLLKCLQTQPSKLQQSTPEENITASGLEINTLATVQFQLPNKPQLT